ncbi:MAG TPA: thioredoxin domain-containing protein, partial [Solirubrobacterales bacterium]|nr:thioredoxin domain-containing protein [Solirubrobacterales bacterium]
EGEEGRFYVWTPAEIREILGDSAGPVLDFYGVSEAGNFEGRNVLHRAGGADAPEPEGLAEARRALYEARAGRPRPGLDDKRLASWNALAIAALAEAGAVLGRRDYLEAARTCADFVLGMLCDKEGRLLRSFKDGEARLNAYLEDHAFLLEALLTLYEASFERRWFERGQMLADTMVARFGDPERGGFYSTSDDHEALIARRKEIGDHPIPSGNSAAALGLLRLAALTGDRSYEGQAIGVLRLFGRAAARQPDAFAHLLRALDFHASPTREVALIAPRGAGGPAEALAELAGVVRAGHRPHLVLAGGAEGTTAPPLLRDRPALEGRPAAYVCESFACKAPMADPEELALLL